MLSILDKELNPAIFLALSVESGEMSRQQARDICRNVSRGLLFLGDEPHESSLNCRLWTMFGMIIGIPIGVANLLVAALRRFAGTTKPKWDRFNLTGLMVISLNKKNLSEEDVFTEANSWAEIRTRVDPHLADLISDLNLSFIGEREDSVLWARGNLTRARVLNELGLYDAAMVHLEKAYQFYKERGMQAEQAECELLWAWHCVDLREYEKALQKIDEARINASASGFNDGLEKSDWLEAIVRANMGQVEKAMTLYRSDCLPLQEEHSEIYRAYETTRMARLAPDKVNITDYRVAIDVVKQALESAKAGLSCVEYDLMHAEYLMSKNHDDEAIKILSALESDPRHTLETRRTQALDMARACSRSGQIATALTYYEKLLALLEDHREQLTDEDVRGRHLEAVYHNYREIIGFFFHNRWYDASLQCVERLKTRMLIDRLDSRNSRRVAGERFGLFR